MPLHRQVSITLSDGSKIEADEGIADLVVALNDCGFRTFASCEDQPDTPHFAWVGLRSVYQAERLAGLIDGILIRPNAEEIANADPDDPGLEGGCGVGFPNGRISEVLSAVVESRSMGKKRRTT